ncbi:MAG: hypothetical protein ACI4GZ_03510 [Ruminococcus sp.]
MKYETPFIEIFRFQPKANILMAASSFVTESPIEDNSRVTIDDDYDPFA